MTRADTTGLYLESNPLRMLATISSSSSGLLAAAISSLRDFIFSNYSATLELDAMEEN